jgi:hypothetical protein
MAEGKALRGWKKSEIVPGKFESNCRSGEEIENIIVREMVCIRTIIANAARSGRSGGA